MRFWISSFLLSLFIISCSEDKPSQSGDQFDRTAVVVRLADDIILPAYLDFQDAITQLQGALSSFETTPTQNNYEALQLAFREAYIKWQYAGLYNFGPAVDYSLVPSCNIYPVNTTLVESNIISGNADLGAASNFAAQGFPTLEYLLYFDFGGSADLMTKFQEPQRLAYFKRVVNRISTQLNLVINAWNSSYRNSFVSATGTDRGSALGELFNTTLLPYMEVHIREAKFGIPGGQRTGTPEPSKVESLYNDGFSKTLAFHALTAYRRVWEGRDTAGVQGNSILDYVDYMDQRNGTALYDKLESQFDQIFLAHDATLDDYEILASTDAQKLNDVWIVLQQTVFTIKSEIASSLSITISYVDTDGD